MTKLSTPTYINPPSQSAFCSYDPLQLGAAAVATIPDYSRNMAAPHPGLGFFYFSSSYHFAK